MDLYLYNTILNTVWYLFTVIFLLYRFTSFFNYAYHFIRFCGKFWEFLKWSKEYLFNRGHIRLEENIDEQLLPESQNGNNKKGLYEIIKNSCNNIYKNIYHKIWGKYPRNSDQNNQSYPLQESIRESYIDKTHFRNSIFEHGPVTNPKRNYESVILNSVRGNGNGNGNFEYYINRNGNGNLVNTSTSTSGSNGNRSNNDSIVGYKNAYDIDSCLLMESDFINKQFNK